MTRQRAPFRGSAEAYDEEYDKSLSFRTLVRSCIGEISDALARGVSRRQILTLFERKTEGWAKPKTVSGYIWGSDSILADLDHDLFPGDPLYTCGCAIAHVGQGGAKAVDPHDRRDDMSIRTRRYHRFRGTNVVRACKPHAEIREARSSAAGADDQPFEAAPVLGRAQHVERALTRKRIVFPPVALPAVRIGATAKLPLGDGSA